MTDQVNEAFGHYFRDMAGNQHFHTGAVPPSFAHSDITPLYTHPARGVVDEAMVERGARAAWEMVPRGVPWRDANDTIQDDWVRIARVILQAAALPAVPPVPEWTAVLDALDAVNEAANDARHRGEYGKANKLVNARVTLYRAALANEEAATPKDQPAQGVG